MSREHLPELRGGAADAGLRREEITRRSYAGAPEAVEPKTAAIFPATFDGVE